jgi:hypothetical protein
MTFKDLAIDNITDEVLQNDHLDGIISQWLVICKLTGTAKLTIHFFISKEDSITESIEILKDRLGAKIDRIIMHPIFLNSLLN